MKALTIAEIKPYLICDTAIIDVRAPVEFRQGAIPHSVNLPILDDQERATVGTCYKQQGREAAISLGHRIVKDENKKIKMEQWKNFLNKHPQAILTCFRGGLRSQIAQTFLIEADLEIPRVQGGYKEIRQLYLDELESFCTQTQPMKVLTGETGSGKTQLLNLSSLNKISLDLENLAAHRGSAFGRQKWPQPSQASFENSISHRLMTLKHQAPEQQILVEDESRVIGSLHLPENLFTKMRQAPVLQVVEDLEQRIQNIFEEYITDDLEIYNFFENAIKKIQKKLGGLRSQEILQNIADSRAQATESGSLKSNKVWIEKILVWYYDPLYRDSLKSRNPVIEFKGTYAEVQKYLFSN